MPVFCMTAAAACFMAIVLAVAESLYPSEKYDKQVKLIFGLIFALCIIKPFSNGDIDIINSAVQTEASSEKIKAAENGTLSYFKKSVEHNLDTRLADILNENGIYCGKIKTSINISDSGSISISEIEIALCNSEQESEAIELLKNQTGEDIPIKISGGETNNEAE